MEIVKNRVASMAQRLERSRLTDTMNRLTGEIQECRVQLQEADKRQANDAEVKKWRRTVNDVYYDMMDALDEWGIAEMESRVRHFGLSLCFLGPLRKYLYYRRDFEGKIESFISQMQMFRRDGELLEHGKNSIEGARDEGDRSLVERLVLNSADLETRMYGRDVEVTILTRRLLTSRERGIQYLSLVGKAGIGKTTIARRVYNDSYVQNYFELKVWMNVSYEFSLLRIARIIIQRKFNIPIDEVELPILLQRLVEIIEGKRFLFVLDDVRDEDDTPWQVLREICGHGSPGSVILITTRKDTVADKAGCKPGQIMQIGRLSDKDCWLVMRDYVLGSSPDESVKERIFAIVGRDIANKCGGLPDVAKSLAANLRSRRSVQEWLDVLKTDILKTSSIDLTSSLMWSFYFLPDVLRQCLLYCAIFPKDDVDKLIKLWIAQGYFDSHPNDLELETVGARCFRVLLDRCFFHELKKDDKGKHANWWARSATLSGLLRKMNASYWMLILIRESWNRMVL